MAAALQGLILSGGYSARMGRDKALLHYHGMPQRDYLRHVLMSCCEEVFLSCRPDQPVEAEWPIIQDIFDFRSPLNGIASALQQYPDCAWLTVAVDMPRVDEQAVSQLVAARNPEKMATCFYNPARKMPEPLLTIWEPSALPVLLRYIAAGTTGPQHVLNSEAIHTILPADAAVFLNVNCPTDWPFLQ
jgi:molybdenum cofactor guanylyltransferase